MSKEMAVIALGIWVIVIPYLGVPGSWRTIILILTGLGIVSLGFFLRAQVLARGGRNAHAHPFVENDSPSTEHEQKGIHSFN